MFVSSSPLGAFRNSNSGLYDGHFAALRHADFLTYGRFVGSFLHLFSYRCQSDLRPILAIVRRSFPINSNRFRNRSNGLSISYCHTLLCLAPSWQRLTWQVAEAAARLMHVSACASPYKILVQYSSQSYAFEVVIPTIAVFFVLVH